MSADRRPGPSWAGRVALVVALVTGFLVAAPVSQSRSSVSLTLYVYFGFGHDITVRLADGTQVGTQSGTPTVIPAGFYTVALEQPGCVQVPTFELQGPGVNIVDNLSGGEVTSATDPASFLPNSTYTWRNDANKSVVYTFSTSSTVLGTPPPNTTVAASPGGPRNKPSTNTDLVGSDVTPFRGTLTGAVTAAGKLTLAFKGKSVATLSAGRYTIAVTDRSAANGFMLETTTHRIVSLTGTTFTGERSGSVDLTAGRWTLMSRSGKAAFSVNVR